MDPRILRCRDHSLDLRPGNARVMGILNVTPDSFSDGGRFLDLDVALRHALAMLDAGASVIDVGGASSRPRGGTYGDGAAALATQEEIDRVIPVIEALVSERPDAMISIDTVHSDVARAALAAGARIVNDITGLRHDPSVADVAAEFGAALIVMHSVGAWGALEHEAPYEDVIADVSRALSVAVDTAVEAGVCSIAIDPGFGFGKSPTDNLRLIEGTDRLVDLGRPVLIGVSRKSTVGYALADREGPRPIAGRLYGSLALAALGVVRGATLVRTHDVAETADVLRILNATLAP